MTHGALQRRKDCNKMVMLKKMNSFKKRCCFHANVPDNKEYERIVNMCDVYKNC